MQIEPNDIHIWSADLTLTPEQLNQKVSLLSADEYERAQGFHFAIHRQRFIAARSLLRELLSLYLATAPQAIQFTYGENEKPALLSPSQLPIQFNLSHSEDFAVYAFTLHYPIGVDVEKIKEDFNPGVAKRFFSSQENNELMHLPVEKRTAGFYRIWARKEAIIKATGKGLSIPLSAFSVSVHDTCETILLNQTESWSLMPLSVHPDFQSAVATHQSVKRICYWSFSEHLPHLEKVTVL